MPIDRLEHLLQHFTVSARLFHHGPLCGVHDFDETEGIGQLHLIQRGDVEVQHRHERYLHIRKPSLLFYPRPLHHRFVTDATRGADMACASVQFNNGLTSPVAEALPPIVAMPLADVPQAARAIELLFDEAFSQLCGRRAVVDRLFEVVLILIIRQLIQDGAVSSGLLAGLAHPALAQAIVALHQRPAQAWSLEALADTAGMSRTRFAQAFKTTTGMTPGDYLTRWRISLAQVLLRRGKAMK
ncbi:MAG: cupin domain-containing protein, partial [Betaproteobacteria bacterium]|nr:cupin domain-containing protein [Betaproteobacteria bacterium]